MYVYKYIEICKYFLLVKTYYNYTSINIYIYIHIFMYIL